MAICRKSPFEIMAILRGRGVAAVEKCTRGEEVNEGGFVKNAFQILDSSGNIYRRN